ncbi:hypothetical protein LX73_2312 [Fodinibius salinus]|uniref:AAA domain-containing protein n=1 Tax=Fodinibius salinus TaxID=860790 RepID=A0A5D3YF76_9BACT|nr:hypothetical protein [Fodinibius salinus]TYP92066.1 hypothetical protein LX73_2312 [Fodinibius salinus]
MDIQPPVTQIIYGPAMTGKSAFLRKKSDQLFPDKDHHETIHHLFNRLGDWIPQLINIIQDQETVLIDELTLETSDWLILMGVLSKFMTEDRVVYIVTQSPPPDILNKFPNTELWKTQFSKARRRNNQIDTLLVSPISVASNS